MSDPREAIETLLWDFHAGEIGHKDAVDAVLAVLPSEGWEQVGWEWEPGTLYPLGSPEKYHRRPVFARRVDGAAPPQMIVDADGGVAAYLTAAGSLWTQSDPTKRPKVGAAPPPQSWEERKSHTPWDRGMSEPMSGEIITLHGGTFTVVDARYDEDAADTERGHWHLTVVAKAEPRSYPRCPECGWTLPSHAAHTCSRVLSGYQDTTTEPTP